VAAEEGRIQRIVREIVSSEIGVLRAASPKHRLNQEIAKKWNFFKLAQKRKAKAILI